MSGLTARYATRIAGVIACLDRVVVTGTLPTACYADGMTGFLDAKQVRIFADIEFTKPLKDSHGGHHVSTPILNGVFDSPWESPRKEGFSSSGDPF